MLEFMQFVTMVVGSFVLLGMLAVGAAVIFDPDILDLKNHTCIESVQEGSASICSVYKYTPKKKED